MAVEEIEVASTDELVRRVLEVSRDLGENSFLWFRGHSSEGYKLLPGLMRHNKDASEVFDRERRLLTRFRQRSLPYWPAGYPQNDWEHLFAMQHYGVPTRLLDWTENLFVAMHFALASSDQDNSPPIIWCFDPVRWNRATPVLSEYGESIQVLTTTDDDLEAYRPETTKRRNRSPVALFGSHNSGRIVAQRGTFVVWGEEPRPLEEFATEMSCPIWRVKLSGERSTFSKELNALGFGETMVFPELTSLASELTKIEGWRRPR